MRITTLLGILLFTALNASSDAWAYGRRYTESGLPKGAPAPLGPGPAYSSHVKQQRAEVKADGFAPWKWPGSDCQDCEVAILPTNRMLENEDVYEFIRALENEKATILNLYRADAQEYNFLAHMALGILGRESRFFESGRYWLKENMPGMISILKTMRAYLLGGPHNLPSRGPTQIKIVPDRIREHYRISAETLYQPEHAAVATVGYLIEALAEMKRRIATKQWSYITPETYVDYLPYIYFGSKRQLNDGTATPEQNIYVRDMKKYMGYVEIYEKPKH